MVSLSSVSISWVSVWVGHFLFYFVCNIFSFASHVSSVRLCSAVLPRCVLSALIPSIVYIVCFSHYSLSRCCHIPSCCVCTSLPVNISVSVRLFQFTQFHKYACIKKIKSFTRFKLKFKSFILVKNKVAWSHTGQGGHSVHSKCGTHQISGYQWPQNKIPL